MRSVATRAGADSGGRAGRGDRQRLPVRHGPRLDRLDPRRAGLAPVAPQLRLRMPGLLALRPLARRGRDRQLEGLVGERRHRLAIEVAAGVDVHLVLQQQVTLRRRGDLQRRHEREVGDRSVAGDEQHEVAARRHLAGDALEIVARAVHEIEAGRGERIGVVDDVIDRRPRILLVHRAERLQRDVVEAAQLVAAGRIALRRHAVPGQALLEALDVAQHAARNLDVARVAQHVGLGAGGLVRLAQDAGPAVADQLVHDGAGERVAGHAGEGVRAAALQRDPQPGQRLLGADVGFDGVDPAAHDLLARRQSRGQAAADAEERVPHVVERQPVLAHERLEPRVGDRLDAEIEREDRADVRVDHEAGQRAQHLGGVVRLAGPAALGVGDGDDAVDPGCDLGERLQPRRELARDAGGARRRAEDHDGVARADAAAAGAAIAAERPRPRDALDRLAGRGRSPGRA